MAKTVEHIGHWLWYASVIFLAGKRCHTQEEFNKGSVCVDKVQGKQQWVMCALKLETADPEGARDGSLFWTLETETVHRGYRRCALQSWDSASAWWPHRKGTEEKKNAAFSFILPLEFFLVLPLADLILEPVRKLFWVGKICSWLYLLFHSHTLQVLPLTRLSLFTLTNIDHVASPQKILKVAWVS